MTRNTIEPTVTTARDGETQTHPAFGQITVHRISGSRALYGSDFMHHSFVRVAIHRSELRRDLSRDWHYPEQRLIEIDMSEAQWATFVSSFNVGAGVPCTINAEGGRSVPEFPLRDAGQRYKPEADAKLTASIKAIEKAMAEVEDQCAGLSKQKREAMLGPLRRAHMELNANLPFVADSLAKHMETRVEKAKVEIEAYISGAVQRAGLRALAAAGDAEGTPYIEVLGG